MLLISNHLLQYPIKFAKDAVVRINIAWIGSFYQLDNILDEIKNDVFIDYPEGRAKPPPVGMTLTEVMDAAAAHKNVKYMAVSNIESGNIAGLFARSMPEGVQFVPKIETIKGVNNIHEIIKQSKPNYIMLDTEDLFLDLKGDVERYENLITQLESICLENNVTILKIEGVVFAPCS